MQAFLWQTRVALAIAALAFFSFSTAVAQTAIQPKRPVEIEEFDFLLGEWTTRVDVFDEKGDIRRVQTFGAVVEPILEAHLLRHHEGLARSADGVQLRPWLQLDQG